MPSRVLIFEDAHATRTAYEEMFEKAGIETKIYSSRDLSPSDMEDINVFDPNLIITDLLLGTSKLDGYTLIRRLQNVEKLQEVPIVVVSKFINSSERGQQEADDVEGLPGVVASYSKIHDLPTVETLLSHAKQV